MSPVGPFRNRKGLCRSVSAVDWPEVMFGICSDFRMGAIASVTALSAVPIIAMSPALAILRASSVPTVGSP